MFDVRHYVQSGGRVLYLSLEEKSKINCEKTYTRFIVKGTIKAAAIFPNNYEQSYISDCTSLANNRHMSALLKGVVQIDRLFFPLSLKIFKKIKNKQNVC